MLSLPDDSTRAVSRSGSVLGIFSVVLFFIESPAVKFRKSLPTFQLGIKHSLPTCPRECSFSFCRCRVSSSQRQCPGSPVWRSSSTTLGFGPVSFLVCSSHTQTYPPDLARPDQTLKQAAETTEFPTSGSQAIGLTSLAVCVLRRKSGEKLFCLSTSPTLSLPAPPLPF